MPPLPLYTQINRYAGAQFDAQTGDVVDQVRGEAQCRACRACRSACELQQPPGTPPAVLMHLPDEPLSRPAVPDLQRLMARADWHQRVESSPPSPIYLSVFTFFMDLTLLAHLPLLALLTHLTPLTHPTLLIHRG